MVESGDVETELGLLRDAAIDVVDAGVVINPAWSGQLYYDLRTIEGDYAHLISEIINILGH